ncbi:MAG: hypothetical protein ACJ74O_14720 [Frankiaceae bacterium]
MTELDDGRLLAAMRAYLRATDALARAVDHGDERAIMDGAEQRSIAAMAVHRRLVELGWTAPVRGHGRSPLPGGRPEGEAAADSDDAS